jgi:glycine/D-amino acid oxidase-like deaminating enzyme
MNKDSSRLFSSDYCEYPFWWERTPRPQAESAPLPETVDVLIVGSGYTGLCAALQTARGGRATLVIDSAEPGWGCSSRNGGQVSTGIKPDFASLERQFGQETAFAVHREGQQALSWIGDFIQDEAIDCDYRVCGRFFGAHTARHYDKLAQKLESQPTGLEMKAFLVPRSQQSAEIDTSFYHGGLVQCQHAAVDPAAYHQGILERVIESGASVIGHTRATSVERRRDGAGFAVDTDRGRVRAGEVIVATSGYTSRLTPWHQRRVFPIGTYMIATEDLGDTVARSLIPSGRMIVDTRRIVVYYRLSPDGRRILFGGRVSLNETNPRISAPRLHDHMTTIFPQLREAKVSHSWMGFVGWTFQHMPHLGRHDGIWYSMGYCGSGVALASYFGTRLGQQVLGLEEGRSVLSDLPFRTRPLYYGKPWFLSASVGWYGFLDRLGI